MNQLDDSPFCPVTVDGLPYRALDLGSGPRPADGYVGLDLCEAEAGFEVLSVDLLDGRRWPFADGSVTKLRCRHFIEHIPHGRITTGSTRVRRTVRRHQGRGGALIAHHYETVPTTQDPFFWFFDEAFRIAAPGCRFELSWPHPQSDEADQDPTHTRRIPLKTLDYLSREGRRHLCVQHYPVACDWRLEPGSAQELGTAQSVAPFVQDGMLDVAAARQHHGSFFDCRAVLVKPGLE